LEKLRKIGFAKLIPLEEALENLLSRIKCNKMETIEVSSSLGRVLANDIMAPIDIPPFDRAAMDGYAINAEDSFGASPKNPKQVKLIGTIDIGQKSEIKVQAGTAIRISTGAALPLGADAVIKIEDTDIDNNIVTLFNSVVPGKNVSKKGEDIKKGQKVLNSGIKIGPEHVALLASLGITKIKVTKLPIVSIFTTGDELIELGYPLEKNKIYNSNLYMIENLVKKYGGSLHFKETLKDDKDLIIERLNKSIVNSDLVIFTGGTSVGKKDLLPEIMQENGEVLAHGLAIRPGSPILIAIIKNKPVFCLPGTPVAAYVCFLRIVGPAISKMLGLDKLDPRVEVFARMERDVPVSSLGYINFLRVKLEKLKDGYVAIPIRLKGSGIISSLTNSDGIVEIPTNEEGLKKDSIVKVKLHP